EAPIRTRSGGPSSAARAGANAAKIRSGTANRIGAPELSTDDRRRWFPLWRLPITPSCPKHQRKVDWAIRLGAWPRRRCRRGGVGPLKAIISDIHANMEALEAVLADIERQGINEI